MKMLITIFTALFLAGSAISFAQELSHEEHGPEEQGQEEHEHEESGAVHLAEQQMKMADVVVQPVTVQRAALAIEAPGEVVLDSYATAQIAPRISAQIINRHKQLGDHVKPGEPLVSLSSVEVAEAQGDFIVANREWARVQTLGKKTVSEKRYIEAQVKQKLTRSKLHAFGMTDSQIKQLATSGGKADGEVDLLSPMAGVVIRDEFVLGEVADAGRVLMTITDESKRWVNARVTADEAHRIHANSVATVTTNDGTTLHGKVTQLSHTFDETTRTRVVRVAVKNPGDILHPGQFVTVSLQGDEALSGLVVPDSALQRGPDGDWVVFVEKEPNEFEPKEVELIQNLAGKAVIEGLNPGDKVVTNGVFFLMSERNKSGFDVHNH